MLPNTGRCEPDMFPFGFKGFGNSRALLAVEFVASICIISPYFVSTSPGFSS